MSRDVVTFKGKKFSINDGILNLSRSKISNMIELVDLENCTNINSLDLSWNQFTKIKELDLFQNLTSLILDNNRICDINGLENLENLEILSLGHNQIKEIQDLDNLSSLKELYFNDNPIEKIKGLESLYELEILSLSECKISDINGLDNLTNLKELNLSYNEIKNISGLENLTNLQRLLLNHNKIQKISGLTTLENLEFLDLQYNQDISIIQGLGNLRRLKIFYLLYGTNLGIDYLTYFGGVDEPEGYALEPQKIVKLSNKGSEMKIKHYSQYFKYIDYEVSPKELLEQIRYSLINIGYEDDEYKEFLEINSTMIQPTLRTKLDMTVTREGKKLLDQILELLEDPKKIKNKKKMIKELITEFLTIIFKDF